MVPIHDTDVAQERWSKAEWENYELWEKVELRHSRQRRLWIVATMFLFLVLSAVPIVMERWPKWMTRSATRVLSQEINRLKREASSNRAAFRLKFIREGELSYLVERLEDCSAEKGVPIRSGMLIPPSSHDLYTWIPSSQGTLLGIPGLVGEFCYDYLAGSQAALKGNSVIGFGVIPAKDLTERKLDRLSTLLLTGPSAEVSFE